MKCGIYLVIVESWEILIITLCEAIGLTLDGVVCGGCLR